MSAIGQRGKPNGQAKKLVIKPLKCGRPGAAPAPAPRPLQPIWPLSPRALVGPQ
jgi:hypothetical protein